MPKKRAQGSGEIETRTAKDGTVTHRARPRVAGKKETIGTFATYEAAASALDEFHRELAKEAPLAGMTLSMLGMRWLAAREEDGVHRSVSKDRHAFKRVTRHAIAQLTIAAVTPRDVRDWVADQVKTGAAKTTIQNPLNLLRVCLEWACDRGLLERNPALGIKVPKLARTKEPWTWMRRAEIDALLLGDDEDRDIYACAIYMGVRAGELFGLEWTDVDLVNGVATIRYSWKGKPTKPGHVRTVNLLQPAVESLRRQRARSGRRKSVFPARDGEARSMDQMPDLGAALRRAGIARHVRFHDLRHTCASALLQGIWAPYWIARPLRLEEVKEWLGHGSIAATQRYAHLCPEAVSGLVVRAAPSLAPTGPMTDTRIRVKKARK